MSVVYGTVLGVGIVLLLAWIALVTLSEAREGAGFDPERSLGAGGRTVVAALVGFGMAGTSAEYSPLDLGPGAVAVLALVGAVGAVWYARRTG